MSGYEATRLRHLDRFGEVLPELLLHLEWSRERIEQEQTTGLRRLVRLACERSPWHRERLRQTPHETLSLSDLSSLPTMTKDDLMANWNEIVTDSRITLDLVDRHLQSITSDAYLFDTYHAITSGGSSGRRGVFIWDWDGWASTFASQSRWSMRYAMKHPASRPPVIAALMAAAPTHMTAAMGQTFARPFPPVHSFPATMPMSQIIAGLNAVQPTHLVGYSSVLYELARRALDCELRISPMIVAAGAEPLWPEMRAVIERAWGAPVGCAYGTSEGGYTAVSCYEAGGMHVSEDLLMVELVDQEERAVAAGRTASKVLLTNFSNTALPLIRYEITDEVAELSEPCPCGSAFKRIDDIQGRLDNVFTYLGGVVIHPHVFRSPLSRVAGIIEYQVRQTADGAEIAIRADHDVDMQALGATLCEHLERAGLNCPGIRLERVSSIERTGAGKLVRFVPLTA